MASTPKHSSDDILTLDNQNHKYQTDVGKAEADEAYMTSTPVLYKIDAVGSVNGKHIACYSYKWSYIAKAYAWVQIHATAS